jgi:hypothetical protein
MGTRFIHSPADRNAESERSEREAHAASHADELIALPVEFDAAMLKRHRIELLLIRFVDN